MNKHLKFIVVVIILVGSAIINYHFSEPDMLTPRKDLSDFPKNIGEWGMVQKYEIDGRSMEILQVDDYLMRNYRNSNGDIVGLYIGYFKSQKEGKGIHSPRQCLPGSGWTPVATSIYEMPIPDHNPVTVPVNKFVMGKGLDRHLYLFWYQGRGRIYASEYWNKIYLIFDGLSKRRTDGALIRINNSSIEGSENALKTQTEFINSLFPLLKEYIPE